jgi:hypothetical protein
MATVMRITARPKGPMARAIGKPARKAVRAWSPVRRGAPNRNHHSLLMGRKRFEMLNWTTNAGLANTPVTIGFYPAICWP